MSLRTAVKRDADETREDEGGVYGWEIAAKHPRMVRGDIREDEVCESGDGQHHRNESEIFFLAQEEWNADEAESHDAE